MVGLACDGSGGACYASSYVPQDVWWLQLEGGWEMVTSDGVTVRAGFGPAFLLGSPDWHCEDEGQPAECTQSHVLSIAVATVALGYAF